MNARQPPGAPAASAAAEDAELAEAEALIDLAGLRRWITCVCACRQCRSPPRAQRSRCSFGVALLNCSLPLPVRPQAWSTLT